MAGRRRRSSEEPVGRTGPSRDSEELRPAGRAGHPTSFGRAGDEESVGPPARDCGFSGTRLPESLGMTGKLEWPLMARPSSVLCPSCGTLVGVRDAQCLNCGRRNPGMWGFAHLLRDVGDDMGFAMLVMWACGALYLASPRRRPRGRAQLGPAVVPLAEHAEPVPVRGERGGAGLRLRALVDGPQRGVAARGRAAHPLQHDVGPRPRAADRAAVRPGPDRDHLHRVGDHRVPGEQPRRRLPAVPAALPRRRRLHRRRLGADLRPHRGAAPLRPARRQLASSASRRRASR